MPLQLTFVTSAKRQADLPDSPREIAVVGAQQRGQVVVAQRPGQPSAAGQGVDTPGRTQLLNIFALPSGATVVDLPGYGYAAVPKREQAQWQAMIEGYLLEREPLELVLVLVDGEIGPTKLDQQMLEWLRAQEVPHAIVRHEDRQGSSVQARASASAARRRVRSRTRRRDVGQRGEGHRHGRAGVARAQPPRRMRTANATPA